MFSASSVILIVALYMGILFLIAQRVEKRISLRGAPSQGSQALMYGLSLAVYHTSWTFYGSVGFAATSGLLFLGIYGGAILGIMLWGVTLKRMVYAKTTFRITSIADFISTRYNRSQKIAALVTLICLLGIAPYISLQLKAVISSVDLITHSTNRSLENEMTGMLVALFMAIFTIAFGVRRIDPTERHPGVMAVLVAECLVKLIAFMMVGWFATYHLFDGFGDIFSRLEDRGLSHVYSFNAVENSGYMWVTLLLLSFAAIQNLPRQFHVAVVENSNPKHVRTAMWILPLYMILMNLFVVPIAAAGLLQGLPITSADYFVLLLPQQSGEQFLTLLAFIGGFSAATGMIIITTMTLSTMASNHLVMPLIDSVKGLRFMHRYLLQIRWGLVLAILFGSLWFAEAFSDSYILVAIGLISFVAVLQFTPALFGGLFWKRGNSAGALMGLMAGFIVWSYTLLLPAFIQHGWFDQTLLTQGPWQIDALRPEALFGIEGLHPITHAVLWSMVFNLGCYLVGSLLYSPNKAERTLTCEFMAAMRVLVNQRARPTGLNAYILLEPKLDEAILLLSEFHSEQKAQDEVQRIAEDLQVADKTHISIIELMEFHRMLEHILAGSVGSAGAHNAIEKNIRYNERESADLKALYSHIISELNTGSAIEKVAEDDSPTSFNIIEDLQNQIDRLEIQVKEQSKTIESLEGKLEQRNEALFKSRLEVQRAQQEVHELRIELSKNLN
ncbi:hypothetical protein [Neptuniibacter sp. CAU 1671]|uniref:hypothetical protein n=1 Tax=Neptuniibacter sp. CAU 1671 TaxID=3032593 RepID=UPI0023DA6652|nr:hypothetical protein [Neptuniibacter sp. CAU 1671]MDF2181991.1 hypothetical protein [Neptuniibacter sp. CAU 1671]